jgi:enoyl-CoA hydratase/carnithine racemase
MSSLSLGPAGQPETPVKLIDLDGWVHARDDQVIAAARSLGRSLPLTIGVASKPLQPRLTPMLHALTLTLASGDQPPGLRQVVGSEDVDASLGLLMQAVERKPQAAVALGHLLRQTEVLDTTPALAAEAATYSMLLSGHEFRSWLEGRPRPRPAGPAATDGLVLLDRVDDRLAVELNEPERRNPLSFAMRESLFDALEVAALDDSISSVVLSGAGPAFCSGGDLAEFGTTSDPVAAYLVRLDNAPWRLLAVLRERLDDRLVVRVRGAAVGAGAELAAFGGFVCCTPSSTFRLPEVSMGLVPGAGGTVSITRRIGRWRAAWAMLTGIPIDAALAVRWGLVNLVEPPGSV